MFGSRKDEELQNGNFESDYSVPGTAALTSFDVSADVNKMDLKKLDEKIDSVVNWITQFYDRFRYLDEEVGTIRMEVSSNKAGVNNLIHSSESSNSIKLSTDIEKLDVAVKDLVQKVDVNKGFIEDGLKNNNVQLNNAQMNELSRMSDVVNVNVEKSKRILEEVKNMFLEIRDIKDRLEVDLSKVKALTPESKVRAALDSHRDIIGARAKVKVDNRYKKLVEDKKEKSVVSHPVGSREWLREVKKRS